MSAAVFHCFDLSVVIMTMSQYCEGEYVEALHKNMVWAKCVVEKKGDVFLSFTGWPSIWGRYVSFNEIWKESEPYIPPRNFYARHENVCKQNTANLFRCQILASRILIHIETLFC